MSLRQSRSTLVVLGDSLGLCAPPYEHRPTGSAFEGNPRGVCPADSFTLCAASPRHISRLAQALQRLVNGDYSSLTATLVVSAGSLRLCAPLGENSLTVSDLVPNLHELCADTLTLCAARPRLCSDWYHEFTAIS